QSPRPFIWRQFKPPRDHTRDCEVLVQFLPAQCIPVKFDLHVRNLLIRRDGEDSKSICRKAEAFDLTKTRVLIISTVGEIETAIAQLTVKDAENLREWLEQWLEDQMEMTAEFAVSIERGNADLAAGRSRNVRP